MKLNRVVDIAQNRAHAVLVIHIQLQEADHAEIIDHTGHRTVELLETAAGHNPIDLAGILQVDGVGVTQSVVAGVFVVEEAGVRVDEAAHGIFGESLGRDEVHFGEHVDVREFEVDHGGHGGEGAREELGGVDYEGRFEEVGRAEVDVQGAHAREVACEFGE